MSEDRANLDEFQRKLELRNLTLDDFASLIELELRCFPSQTPWTEHEFRAHLERFPEGQFGIFVEGRLVASSSSLIIQQDDYGDLHNWKAVSGNGTIENHDPDGDTLYGIEIQVDPEFRGMRLARRLYEARKRLVQDRELARIAIGGRIPGYAARRQEMTAREYVEAVIARRLHDPVLTVQLANGFSLRALIPDYDKSDEDSAGYATHLEWTNLDHVPDRHRQRRAVRMVKLAAVQWQMRQIAHIRDFEQQCRFFVDTASDYGSDFVVFPELFTLELLTLLDNRKPEQAIRRLAEYTPRYLELFRDLALRGNVNIVAGSTVTYEADTLYNVAHLFRRDGTLERQKKIHITQSEARWWGVQGGDEVQVFDTDRGRIAILVCYDCEFPEIVRVAVAKGARILFVPYNTNDRYGHIRVRTSALARCIENHIYTVTAGCVGNLPFVENADVHYAQSGVYTPLDVGFAWDGIAAEASPNQETVLVHEVDTEQLRRHRMGGTTRNWNDRRTDLYRVLWRGPSPEEI